MGKSEKLRYRWHVRLSCTLCADQMQSSDTHYLTETGHTHTHVASQLNIYSAINFYVLLFLVLLIFSYTSTVIQ